MVHRYRPLVGILVDDLARRRPNGVDDRMIARGGNDHFRIGPFERLGTHPAQKGPQRLGISRVIGDFENLVVLDKRIAPHGLTLARDPDHVGVLAADHPAPVFLGADDRPGCVSVLQLVERHQVAQLDLAPGPDVPECAAPLDHPVAHLGQVSAHGLGKRLPAANTPAQRPVELWHAGRQDLEHDAVVACSLDWPGASGFEQTPSRGTPARSRPRSPR